MKLFRRVLSASMLVAALVSTATAADLDEVVARGELIWAADQEGGGPHVFPDPTDPRRLTGFEVDLAAVLAKELGVKAQFQQGQWDRLPLLLGRADAGASTRLPLFAALFCLQPATPRPPRRSLARVPHARRAGA